MEGLLKKNKKIKGKERVKAFLSRGNYKSLVGGKVT